MWPLLSRLERAVPDAAARWRWLLDTPDVARRLLMAVLEERARARRNSLTYRSLGLRGPVEDDESITSPALDQLAELMAHVDSAID